MKHHLHLIGFLGLVLCALEASHADHAPTIEHDLSVVTADPFEMDDFDLDPIAPVELTEIRPVHTLMEDPDLPDDWTLDDIDVSDEELPYIDLPTLGPDFGETPLDTTFMSSSDWEDFDDPEDQLFLEDPSLLTDPSINAYWMAEEDMGPLDDPYDTTYTAPSKLETKLEHVKKGVQGLQDVVAASRALTH